MRGKILWFLSVLLVGCGPGGVVEKSLTEAENQIISQLDRISPTVVSIYPADNATGVSQSDNLSITFSEEIAESTIVLNTDNTTCSGSIQASSDNFANCVRMSASASTSDNITFTADPSDNFTSEATYKIRITTVITDKAGNSLSENQTSPMQNGFVVKDWLAPSLSAISPADGATGVNRTTMIQFQFSEVMDTSSITVNTGTKACSDNIQVSSSTDNFSALSCVMMSSTISISSDNKSFTITPSDNLSASTIYLIRVKSSVKDEAGNEMGSDNTTVTGFTTGS